MLNYNAIQKYLEVKSDKFDLYCLKYNVYICHLDNNYNQFHWTLQKITIYDSDHDQWVLISTSSFMPLLPTFISIINLFV